MRSALAQVDDWASSGASVWHRASALSKMALVAMLVGSAIASHSVAYLAALYLTVWLLVATAGLPLRPVLQLSLYPVAFSLLFLIARWDGTWQTSALLLLRALTGSLAAAWLVATTPYPDLFAPISRLTPRVIGDGLFLTYRAFFDLLRRAEQLLAALRLRGGLQARNLPRDLRNVGEGLGTLVIYLFGRSSRLYAVMQLRGHRGRICGCRHWAQFTAADLLPLGIGIAALLAAHFAERRA